MIEADFEDSKLLEHPDLWRQTSSKVVVHENDFIQRFAHLPYACRNATSKIVVGEDQYRNGRVAKVLRNTKSEPVVV